MSIQHISRTGRVYYLHALPAKNGKTKYHFSTKAAGRPVERVPDGFEIYENIRGQVFLRRITLQLITKEELIQVTHALKNLSKKHFYQAEIKRDAIVVYEADNRVEDLAAIALPWISKEKLQQSARSSAYFMAVFRFILVDRSERLFVAERFCFRGSVEDWIGIGCAAGKLPALLKKYLKHLGEESMYDLY